MMKGKWKCWQAQWLVWSVAALAMVGSDGSQWSVCLKSKWMDSPCQSITQVNINHLGPSVIGNWKYWIHQIKSFESFPWVNWAVHSEWLGLVDSLAEPQSHMAQQPNGKLTIIFSIEWTDKLVHQVVWWHNGVESCAIRLPIWLDSTLLCFVSWLLTIPLLHTLVMHIFLFASFLPWLQWSLWHHPQSSRFPQNFHKYLGEHLLWPHTTAWAWHCGFQLSF